MKISKAPPLTKDNVDQLLDAGRLEIAMQNGKWWTIRRNGATKLWKQKRNQDRIRIPFKVGLYSYGTLGTEWGGPNNHSLNSPFLRVKE
jgi:hypothetical protein